VVIIVAARAAASGADASTMRFVSVRAKVRQNFAPDLRGVDLRGVVCELVPTAGAMHPGELKLMQLEKTNAVKAAELAATQAKIKESEEHVIRQGAAAPTGRQYE
jgi:hypothetical protein